MDDTIANVQCESCGKDFDIPARNYERIIQEDQPILCNLCFDLAVDEQDEASIPERRKFEYIVTDEEIDFNSLGQDGWELIQITNNKAYFKRELVKGLE
jgi:hypothetical protein